MLETTQMKTENSVFTAFLSLLVQDYLHAVFLPFSTIVSNDSTRISAAFLLKSHFLLGMRKREIGNDIFNRTHS